MEKQQSSTDVSRLVAQAMRPFDTQAERDPQIADRPQKSGSRMTRLFAPLRNLTQHTDILLNLICVLLALGFLALAASNVTVGGNFLTIDSLFFTAVCVMMAGIFLVSPALTLKERGLLKWPLGARTATTAAFVDEGPIHFEGSAKLFMSVLGGLLGLTLIEVVLAYMQVSLVLMLIILIGLSLIKAALIIAYFMHLRFERLSLVLTLVPILVVCICLLFIFFPDSIRSLNLRATGAQTSAATTTTEVR